MNEAAKHPPYRPENSTANPMTVGQAIIACARRQDPGIGDDAMIAEGEYGYWVGARIYVSKAAIEKFARSRREVPLEAK